MKLGKPVLVFGLLYLCVLRGFSFAQVLTDVFGVGPNEFSIDLVAIGNPGNSVDPYGTGWNKGTSPGSVNYDFSIGKHEIRRSDIEKANLLGNLGITLYDTTYAGWNGMNKPATGISWYEAARFVNYLNQSKGFAPAYKFVGAGTDQVFSAWTVGDSGYNPNNPFRNQNSKYVLPSLDEWHKAAYYNPTNDTYSTYPNGSNLAPIPMISGVEGSVYGQSITNQVGPANVYEAGSMSFYGTMAQGGNALELMETSYDLFNDDPSEPRWFSGGSWVDDASLVFFQSNTSGAYISPDTEFFHMGFRVASVPEPEARILMILATLLGLACRRHYKS
jgi:hypothetical protein